MPGSVLLTAPVMPPADSVKKFIDRWSQAEASERANYVLFLSELCDQLEVPRPDPAGPDSVQNAYVFERSVTFQHRGGKTSTGRIDLYKRGAFVCECKQYANAVAGVADPGSSGLSEPGYNSHRQGQSYPRRRARLHTQATPRRPGSGRRRGLRLDLAADRR